MARDTLTGSRIRERRIIAGLKQAELARAADISASYLNLIEHNRRRIGGKLLVEIARLLDVEPALLTEGAGATLVQSLREAASSGEAGAGEAELDRVDEFAGRFPGWAGLLAAKERRVGTLERAVETLSDRLTHDPQLAASLHEMLSRVTAIRSAASILAEPGEISPEWQGRFHRNIYEDSGLLAETSRALVAYLEAGDEPKSQQATAPQEELDAILGGEGYAFPSLEAGEETPEALAARLSKGASEAAAGLLTAHLARAAADIAALPAEALATARDALGPDPVALAARLGQPIGRVMRRLAAMPEAEGARPGLVICDASGVLTARQPIADFPLPRFGAGCPLWPLYAALNRPGVPLTARLEQPGRPPRTVRAFAVAEPAESPRLDRPPLYEAVMLVLPDGPEEDREAAAPQPVGVNCRICPRRDCPGRREPTILAAERDTGF
ncbi:short-chain fatty acyl-CoA regulator family protein [Roseivivax sp. GX 12232]|uniref:short-chain fatty acyl-CoA regulator family protein n=1 Tax=Roseivivax sp. GX 12232 TaxID=2900547 RepID=UPI001E49CCC3|nr:short-chain fatty acyl-CoA regulator family protein [Roseivivax sp. GX 12232]MCE0506879.1 short-chain fatty acyl-CoA regulator family protein [Roseivivax sp. GX 12232]